MVPLEIRKDQKSFLGWTDIIGPEVHLVFLSDCSFFSIQQWNSIMLHDRSMKTIYWTEDVTDLSPVHIEHSRGQPLHSCGFPQVSYTHDRDFGRYKVWPTGKKERFMGRGWCPPRGKEYETWPIFDDEVWIGSLFCLLLFDLWYWTHCSSSRMF